MGGNSTPSEQDRAVSPKGPPAIPTTNIPSTTTSLNMEPNIESEDIATQATTPPTPNYSINLEKLRRIFQALSSLNQNKTTEAEVGEEPLQMRRKYLGIFERFEMRFGSNKPTNGEKKRTLQNPKERLLAFINRKNNTENTEEDESKTKVNWARTNLSRLTSSMRRVKSDSFIARKITKRHKKRAEILDHEQIRLPSMKTKNRSSVSKSKALITSASHTAHVDLVKHLQANSSQHCLDDIDFWNYDYPFENLVFEGGGAKVHTYIGAIKVSYFNLRITTMGFIFFSMPDAFLKRVP